MAKRTRLERGLASPDWAAGGGSGRPKLSGTDQQRVKLYLEWEGSVREAREVGAVLKRLIADLEEEPGPRRRVLALRKLWRESCLEAGVEHG